MRNIKKLVFIIMLFCGHVYGMAPTLASVKTFLFPKAAEEANEEFLSLLDSARNEVLIAMYWITDQNIVDKIIDLRTRKRINVQVIFDASSLYREELIETFLRHDIQPIVFPSKVTETLMHNKFLVIDNQKVWTGSANFTKKAMDPGSRRFNHENIVVIDSEEIAKKFVEGFNVTKSEAFSLYIKLLANNGPNDLPRFVAKLSPILYQKDLHFKEVMKRMLPGLNASEIARLERFFPGLEGLRPASFMQRQFLQTRRSFTPGMSYEEAYQLVGQIMQQEKRPQSQKPVSDW